MSVVSAFGNAVAVFPEPVVRLVRDDVYVVEPSRLGLGEDRIIGGASGPSYRKIDLSRLIYPVEIVWTDVDCGTITDGADSIVFQGIEQIILPDCMQPRPDGAPGVVVESAA